MSRGTKKNILKRNTLKRVNFFVFFTVTIVYRVFGKPGFLKQNSVNFPQTKNGALLIHAMAILSEIFEARR